MLIGVCSYYQNKWSQYHEYFAKDPDIRYFNSTKSLNYKYLFSALNAMGHQLIWIDDIKSQDLNKINIFLFFDFFKKKQIKGILKKILNSKIKKYLIISENKSIQPHSWNTENHKFFKKVFTWDRNLVDNSKYFKIPSCFFLKSQIDHFSIINSYENIYKTKTKFSAMFANNKSQLDLNDLYFFRKKIINYYENKKSNNFDLYGHGWDRINLNYPNIIKKIAYYDKSKIVKINLKIFNKILGLFKTNFFSPKCYSGFVNDKYKELKKYKFSFCIENTQEHKGFITEKIFESMFCYSVPVYLGAPDIKNIIPKKTFIDAREFKNIKEIDIYISSMSQSTYEEYIINIKNFLSSKSFDNFTTENFNKIIIENILN